jgi:uncharacterized protein YfdQ (DUF2303 family)
MDGEAVEAVALLTQRAASSEGVEFADADVAVPLGVHVRVVDHHQRVERLDLEALHPTPREQRGAAQLHDGPSFAAYVNRLHTESTTLWAIPPEGKVGAGRITAVFYDHTGDTPGWRDHRAELAVRLDPDWLDWMRIDGALVEQKVFAQFLLDHQHNIGAPPPNQLMPAVLQFSAARNAQYESSVNLDNGQVRLVYVEEVKNNSKGKQTAVLPQVITLGLFPFAGALADEPAWPVEAHVRYEIPHDGGALKIGVKLTRPDHVVRQAWDRLCAQLRDEIPEQVLLLQGPAPSALRDRG